MNALSDDKRSECNKAFSLYTTLQFPSLFLGLFVIKDKKDMIVTASFNVDLKATEFRHRYEFAENDGGDAIRHIDKLFFDVLVSFREAI